MIPGIKVYNGIEAFKLEMYNQILETNEPIYKIGSCDEMHDFLWEKTLNELNDKRINKNIKVYNLITSSTKELNVDKNKLKDIYYRRINKKYIPDKNHIITMINSDLVYILIYKEKDFKTIKIKDKNLAKEYLGYFRNLWDVSDDIE